MKICPKCEVAVATSQTAQHLLKCDGLTEQYRADHAVLVGQGQTREVEPGFVTVRLECRVAVEHVFDAVEEIKTAANSYGQAVALYLDGLPATLKL